MLAGSALLAGALATAAVVRSGAGAAVALAAGCAALGAAASLFVTAGVSPAGLAHSGDIGVINATNKTTATLFDLLCNPLYIERSSSFGFWPPAVWSAGLFPCPSR
jgi:hypothetical protein